MESCCCYYDLCWVTHVQVTEHFTTAPAHATQLAAAAVRAGADVVLAVGGDGTLHEASVKTEHTNCMLQLQLQLLLSALQPSC
jgi:NAD kinase